MTETMIDSYPETKCDFSTVLQALHPSASVYRSSGGQCFTSPSYLGYKISSVKFYLKKTGSPTGNAHAVLYAMTGTYGTSGKPTGSALAISDNFDVSTLTTSNQLVTFTFTGAAQYVMQPNTHYCIAYENPIAGTINTSNYVSYGVDTFGDATHSGNEFLYFSSAYTTYQYDDAIFYVYTLQIEGSDFTTLMSVFKSGFRGNPSFEVTRSTLSLGTRDGTTGWYAKNYVDSTVKMILIQKESQNMALKMGYWVSLDALGLTITPIEVYDLITDGFRRIWEVKVVKPILVGDVIKYFVCDLKELPLHA